jgi:predicted Zn-dependent protease
VRSLGRTVAAYSDRPDLPYEFFVVESGDGPANLQAYGLFGGTVVLTRAMAELLADSDDELAFALAHEVAHVALRHHHLPVTSETKGAGARRLGQSISHHQELQADQYGALYAVRAGFSLTGAEEALGAIAEARRGVEERDGHPSYELRLEEVTGFRAVLERSVEAFYAGTRSLEYGDVDEALATLSLFVLQFPQSVEGRVNLGTACLVKLTHDHGGPGGLEEPLPLFEKTPIQIRGIYAGEELERARRSFQEALAVHPTSEKALLGLALVALREGDTDTADALLSRAGQASDRSADLLLARGNARYLADQADRAVALFLRALEVREGWSAAEKNLALAYETLGERELAASVWSGLTEEPRLGDEARWHVTLLRPPE